MKYTLFLYALLFHNFLLCMQQGNQSRLRIPCLRLNSPQHTDAELAEFVRRLPANTEIAGIDFSNSSISDDGIIDLANNIRFDTLENLRLNHMRNITARGLSFILSQLQMNQCLEIVDLHGLPLSNMCQHVIEALYINNQRLQVYGRSPLIFTTQVGTSPQTDPAPESDLLANNEDSNSPAGSAYSSDSFESINEQRQPGFFDEFELISEIDLRNLNWIQA